MLRPKNQPASVSSWTLRLINYQPVSVSYRSKRCVLVIYQPICVSFSVKRCVWVIINLSGYQWSKLCVTHWATQSNDSPINKPILHHIRTAWMKCRECYFVPGIWNCPEVKIVVGLIHAHRNPRRTGKPGKMERHFPVGEKSRKITQNTEKLREFQTNIISF